MPDDLREAAQATTVDEAMAEVRERTGPLPEPSDEEKALCVEGECGGCIICYGPGVPVFGPRTVIALADEIDRLRAALADGVAAGPQATPGQVLWEGETSADGVQGPPLAPGWSILNRAVEVPPGTSVRVVAADGAPQPDVTAP